MTRCLVGQILLDPAWGPQGLSGYAWFSARDEHDRWIVWSVVQVWCVAPWGSRFRTLSVLFCLDAIFNLS